MTVRMVGIWCPNGHLYEAVAYEGEERSVEILEHLIEEMAETKTLVLNCVECDEPITSEGWEYRDRLIEECQSLEDLMEMWGESKCQRNLM